MISGDMQLATGGQEALPASANQQQANPAYSGLIVAQGDSKEGYGLYFMDNKMYFNINEEGKAYQVATTEPLPAKFSFRAGLQKTGVMKLIVNDKEVGSVKTSGLFKKGLDVPLRVGFENKMGEQKIANYPDSFFLARNNILTGAKLEILESIASKTTAGPVAKIITLNVLNDVMKYDKQLITAKAGTTIQITLRNPDFMQHNFVLIKPNTSNKVGAAADQLVRDPNGAKMSYVPKMTEVIAATPLLNPGGKYTLIIKLPAVAGDYPYICTFPGHWRIMKGLLRVTK